MTNSQQFSWAAAAFLLATALTNGLHAQAPPAATTNPPAHGDELSIDQARLADRYARLEVVLTRLAELSASTDPRRAKVLREAISKSRDQAIDQRFESIVSLLEDERLSAASGKQRELQKELDELLSLLLKADRDRELDSQHKRIRAYLKEVGRLIRLERGLQTRTTGDDDLDRLAQEQQEVRKQTEKLGKSIDDTERPQQAGEKPQSVPAAENSPTDSPQPAKKKPSAEDPSNGDQKRADGKPAESSKDAENTNTPADKNASPAEDKSAKNKSPKDKSEQEQSGEQSADSDQSPADKQASGEPGDDRPTPSPPTPGQPSESQPSQGQPSPGEPQPGKSSEPSPAGDSGQPGQAGESQQQQPQEPTDRAAERLKQAQEAMKQAQEQLEKSEREGAADAQREALKQLEQAKAELERILRQLREEEMERTLTLLAARFRKMLDMQNKVYEVTQRLDKIPPENRSHDSEIEAARLSREEALIAREADRALVLLREEGSSLAFPETVGLMREDIQQVVERLAEGKVEAVTQGLERDIIEALEETIAALDKAIKDLEKKKTPPGQSPPAGQPGDPPLVDKIAELKMIRALQMRINRRTVRYGELLEGEQAEAPELVEALTKLAERQQRVYQATIDLSQGRND